MSEKRYGMYFLKNIAVSLTATGTAAIVIIWLICVTVLGIFGSGCLAWFAMIILNIAGAWIVVILGRKI
jgi:hypothetical protein